MRKGESDASVCILPKKWILPKTRHMHVLVLLGVALAVSSALAAEPAKPVTKLQIGVKKRIDACLLKSKHGDILTLHYSVGVWNHTHTHNTHSRLTHAGQAARHRGGF